MKIEIVIVIVLTSFIQSIFGVGVLLFGTPLLLLLGYEFIDVLFILLPISLFINIFQVIEHRKFVDLTFYKKILLFCIPFIILFLILTTEVKLSMNIIVGIFLLFIAAKDYFPKVNELMQKVIKFEKAYFILMGITHGLTNLGGSLLTAVVHTKNYNKNTTRASIAISYGTFALFQILTLIFAKTKFSLNSTSLFIYCIIGSCIYALSNKLVFSRINNNVYKSYFTLFVSAIGLLIIVKEIVF